MTNPFKIIPPVGELNRRVTIRRWVDVPNAAFAVDQTFDAGSTRWGKIEPIHSLALRMGMQTSEMPTHLVWVLYGDRSRPEDITVEHVVQTRGVRYRVLGTHDVQDRRRFTRIEVKALGPVPENTDVRY